MWFDDWNGIARVLMVGSAAYAALVILLRISGKRTLTKLNAFDLVVTVALGSCLATVLLSKDVAALEALAAFVVLVGGQFVLTWLSVRSNHVRRIIKSEPRVILWQGQALPHALRAERITQDELNAAIRGHGLSCARDAAAVVLETDGSLHVLTQARHGDSAIRSVQGVP